VGFVGFIKRNVSLYIYICLDSISNELYRPIKYEVFTKDKVDIFVFGFTTPCCRPVGEYRSFGETFCTEVS